MAFHTFIRGREQTLDGVKGEANVEDLYSICIIFSQLYFTVPDRDTTLREVATRGLGEAKVIINLEVSLDFLVWQSWIISTDLCASSNVVHGFLFNFLSFRRRIDQLQRLLLFVLFSSKFLFFTECVLRWRRMILTGQILDLASVAVEKFLHCFHL